MNSFNFSEGTGILSKGGVEGVVFEEFGVEADGAGGVRVEDGTLSSASGGEGTFGDVVEFHA